MKRIVVLMMAALAGVAACGGGATEAPTARKLRFALIPKSLDIPVFEYARIGAERAAAELGVDMIYRGPDKADELKQKEIVESFISQKVDGIAISVLNPEFLTPAIDRAVEAGIPVVTWDSDAPGSKRFAFYGVDDFKSGLIMGEETAKLLGGKGTVAFITSMGANNLKRRLDGAREALAKYPGITIVETYDIKEDSTRSQELIATGSNRYPNLGAWVSVGGWPVFSANSVDPVPANTKFVSFDTVEAALSLLRSGKVQVLLGQKYFGWGGESIRLLDAMVKGNKPTTTIIDSGVDVVTMANVDAYEATWKAMLGSGK